MKKGKAFQDLQNNDGFQVITTSVSQTAPQSYNLLNRSTTAATPIPTPPQSEETKLPEIFNQFDKVYSDDGVSIMIDISDLNTVATHYEQENKRLVELLRSSTYAHFLNVVSKGEQIEWETYWQQYCKENNIEPHTPNRN